MGRKIRNTKSLKGRDRTTPCRDINHNQPLGDCCRIQPAEQHRFPLDAKEPTWQKVVKVVKKYRTGSAPVPSGLTYKTYTMCIQLLRRLWRLLKVIWRKGTVSYFWQTAEAIFVPKEKEFQHPEPVQNRITT